MGNKSSAAPPKLVIQEAPPNKDESFIIENPQDQSPFYESEVNTPFRSRRNSDPEISVKDDPQDISNSLRLNLSALRLDQDLFVPNSSRPSGYHSHLYARRN